MPASSTQRRSGAQPKGLRVQRYLKDSPPTPMVVVNYDSQSGYNESLEALRKRNLRGNREHQNLPGRCWWEMGSGWETSIWTTICHLRITQPPAHLELEPHTSPRTSASRCLRRTLSRHLARRWRDASSTWPPWNWTSGSSRVGCWGDRRS